MQAFFTRDQYKISKPQKTKCQSHVILRTAETLVRVLYSLVFENLRKHRGFHYQVSDIETFSARGQNKKKNTKPQKSNAIVLRTAETLMYRYYTSLVSSLSLAGLEDTCILA